VRVGYGGSITHDGDLRDQAIGALLAAAELPNVELHFFGWHPQFVASRAPGVYPLNGRQYTYHGSYRDVVEYQASIGILDVAIAPLSDNDFNICKSSTKWVEHSCHEPPWWCPIFLEDRTNGWWTVFLDSGQTARRCSLAAFWNSARAPSFGSASARMPGKR